MRDLVEDKAKGNREQAIERGILRHLSFVIGHPDKGQKTNDQVQRDGATILQPLKGIGFPVAFYEKCGFTV